MSILKKIRGEFVDIIEWTQPSEGRILAYRFPRYNHEIKIGAKLTVREGQNAIFVNEGQIADVYGPGMYELSTQNMPILSTMRGWKYGFNSPFKAEVYFIAMQQQTDNKWGTTNPLIKRDVDFGVVRLRAHGSYVFRVVDPARFLRELVATDPAFEDFEIDSQLRQVIVSEFAKVMGDSPVPLLDLLSSYEKLADYVQQGIADDFESWGLQITKFYIANISVPAEVEEAMDRRTSMGVVGDLSRYTQFQVADSIKDAAKNPGGIVGAGVGLGAGMTMAQHMIGAMPGTSVVPPPVPGGNFPFHVVISGQPHGPFDMATLKTYVLNNTLTSDTLVWRQGMVGWEKAGSVSDLQALFASQQPPPVPS